MLGLSLGAGHEFDARQRQKVAELGGVEEIRSVQRPLGKGRSIANRDGLHPVSLHCLLRSAHARAASSSLPLEA